MDSFHGRFGDVLGVAWYPEVDRTLRGLGIPLRQVAWLWDQGNGR